MPIVFENVTVTGNIVIAYTEPFIVTYHAETGFGAFTALSLTNVGDSDNTNAFIDWGDGNSELAIGSNTYSHTYASPGYYQIKIYGYVESISAGFIPNYYFAATSIDTFGTIGLQTLYCENWQELTNVPSSVPSTMIYITFQACGLIDDGNISLWNTENFISTATTFDGTPFNQPLNDWNVSNVADMTDMFQNATSFNQPLNNWNTANVSNMDRMFQNATTFNQDLTDWCVTLIPTEPFNFATDSALDANNYPVWGTCP